MGNHHLSYSDDGWVKVWVAGQKKGDSGNFSGNQALKFYKSMSEELFVG